MRKQLKQRADGRYACKYKNKTFYGRSSKEANDLLDAYIKKEKAGQLLRQHIIETFVNAVYVYDDHLKLVTNNCEGNQRVPLPDLPPECSDKNDFSVPTVSHPNTRVTIYRIAI